jgi:hypothetical protein
MSPGAACAPRSWRSATAHWDSGERYAMCFSNPCSTMPVSQGRQHARRAPSRNFFARVSHIVPHGAIKLVFSPNCLVENIDKRVDSSCMGGVHKMRVIFSAVARSMAATCHELQKLNITPSGPLSKPDWRLENFLTQKKPDFLGLCPSQIGDLCDSVQSWDRSVRMPTPSGSGAAPVGGVLFKTSSTNLCNLGTYHSRLCCQ